MIWLTAKYTIKVISSIYMWENRQRRGGGEGKKSCDFGNL